MFCEAAQPASCISLVFNCGLDTARIPGSKVVQIPGGVELVTPWAFEPGTLVAVGLQCRDCDKCVRPVEMLVADCKALRVSPGYQTTLLFVDLIDQSCGTDSEFEALPA